MESTQLTLTPYSLTNASDKVLLNVLSYLPIKKLLDCRTLSTKFFRLSNDPVLTQDKLAALKERGWLILGKETWRGSRFKDLPEPPIPLTYIFKAGQNVKYPGFLYLSMTRGRETYLQTHFLALIPKESSISQEDRKRFTTIDSVFNSIYKFKWEFLKKEYLVFAYLNKHPDLSAEEVKMAHIASHLFHLNPDKGRPMLMNQLSIDNLPALKWFYPLSHPDQKEAIIEEIMERTSQIWALFLTQKRHENKHFQKQFNLFFPPEKYPSGEIVSKVQFKLRSHFKKEFFKSPFGISFSTTDYIFSYLLEEAGFRSDDYYVDYRCPQFFPYILDMTIHYDYCSKNIILVNFQQRT